MARLENGKLALEVEIESAEKYQSILYVVKMTWNGLPILNPRICISGRVEPGGISVGDFGEDYLSWAIDEAIKTGSCQNWWGMEPDVNMAICPQTAVPFLSCCTAWNSPDNYVIIVFADERNFSDGTGYCLQGPGMVIRCTRDMLTAFSADLKREYEAKITACS